jgi:hypothetical protein
VIKHLKYKNIGDLSFCVVRVDASDQLEGESFQPAYAPYVPPPQAYDGAYEPLEQRGIEAAVSAGAAGYNGVSNLCVFFVYLIEVTFH